ncbi:hypothetical protein H072_11014 [Dactylellina haptotyla CBS 200.50]|uniref:Uncharacterized protein n=1 Tax=Dactylellina haptotyla (strain CBS 200.50) TaxID=1284197 RepID=S8A351_DACHA|nr:hypothetical protein H072_11014 [Dactylellina haptotyla CBS 200.50]
MKISFLAIFAFGITLASAVPPNRDPSQKPVGQPANASLINNTNAQKAIELKNEIVKGLPSHGGDADRTRFFASLPVTVFGKLLLLSDAEMKKAFASLMRKEIPANLKG